MRGNFSASFLDIDTHQNDAIGRLLESIYKFTEILVLRQQDTPGVVDVP
jgi:hypothetical protein